MPNPPPIVYLLYGDDEFAIAQFVEEMEARLGDPALAVMNVTRLDGRSFNPVELLSVAGAMPFLARRRIVILTNPSARLTTPEAQKEFIRQLELLPETTALALIEYKSPDDRERKRKMAWLEQWADKHPERAYKREFMLPKGAALRQFIQERAQALGGQFSSAAAGVLAELVGSDTRQVDQEIQKLLTYVNYKRAVEPEDVYALTADTALGDVFVLVDALGNQDGKQAIGMLHRLLEQQEALQIFGMIVRQFRLLLQAREILDHGGQEAEVAGRLHVHPYVAGKVTQQARRFDLPTLEAVYRRLLDFDYALKTSQLDPDLALDLLVAGFTSRALQPAR